MKFIEETCEQCGNCLFECPFLKLSRESAKEAIIHMIDKRMKNESLKNCIGCGYCDNVCPTNSNPSELIKEINVKEISNRGLPRFYFISEEIPFNSATIAMQIETKTKEKKLREYLNPPKSEEMFYLGCSLSYIQTDLLNTRLLEGLPKIGGAKYCCGGIVTYFGDEEVKIKGKALLEEFTRLGVKKLIMFCPGCLGMMKGVYSNLLPEFRNSIEFQTFSQYLIEKYHKDEIRFTTKINERITFHDPCAWVGLDEEVFNAPRELLEILGYEVVEMKHNRKMTLCCAASVSDSNKELYNEISGMRIAEAEEIDAKRMVVSCTGCLSLAKPARERNIETYHMLELAQMAIGEKPAHRTIELRENYKKLLTKTIKENPNLLKDKVIIKNGKIQHL
ncbi:MAG: (Fe-S)-binding protein [Candidatus Hodarchaeota archaeon]